MQAGRCTNRLSVPYGPGPSPHARQLRGGCSSRLAGRPPSLTRPLVQWTAASGCDGPTACQPGCPPCWMPTGHCGRKKPAAGPPRAAAAQGRADRAQATGCCRWGCRWHLQLAKMATTRASAAAAVAGVGCQTPPPAPQPPRRARPQTLPCQQARRCAPRPPPLHPAPRWPPAAAPALQARPRLHSPAARPQTRGDSPPRRAAAGQLPRSAPSPRCPPPRGTRRPAAACNRQAPPTALRGQGSASR